MILFIFLQIFPYIRYMGYIGWENFILDVGYQGDIVDIKQILDIKIICKHTYFLDLNETK